ncbi:DEAD/DEAH box helicase [Allofournierella massiliensis]|uniref:DEAD/DEAH box helicase n=1 Tax=Allofournierella massiliensis TaxID=1650663 RepID=A0ABT7UUM0_9FIRM|nr:DEAD/DEAH box helicase [Fournierella massiliensis]MDM8202572.1 DEAD/DEAH box helicase [Fournierella massiliensis]
MSGDDFVATVTIDINSSKNEIYLSGDIKALQRHRFAWRYARDYLAPTLDGNRLVVKVSEDDTVSVLSKIHEMLVKYGFEEARSDSSERVLCDFFEEERKFSDFSEKARHIRNNECDVSDFQEFVDSVSSNLPARLLYPLQLLSAYHLAFSQNACNFSVPGAGKTSIVYGAYAYLHALPKENPKHIDRLLIVGPLSSFGPWELEYKECFGRAVCAKRLISGLSKEDKRDYLYSKKPAELTLISYASVVSLKDDLGYFLRYNKVMMVLDEAHKIKNSSGGVTAQAVLKLAPYASGRVVLTGTPAPNGYEDLYNMFKFIWPSKNVIGFEVNQLRDISARPDESRTERLINNISPYFIRIRKSDLNIPPATVNPPILVPMGKYQQRIYDFIEKKYVQAIIEDGPIDLTSKFKAALTQARMIRLMQAATDPAMLKTPLKMVVQDDETPIEADQAIDDSEVLRAITDYEQIETPSKYVAVKELIEKIVSAGEKVVVWATFIHTVLGLKDYLLSCGIACQELYGAIPVEKGAETSTQEDEAITRERIVQEFQSPSCPYKVIIANPFAVAESISLHKACHNAIYMERSFNAAHFVQSKDRIHRYGLKEGTETNYYYVLSKDSIDETIDLRLSEKERRMIEIMESMPIPLFDNVSDDLGDEDVKALISAYVRRTKKP